MKASEQFFPVMLFVILYNVVPSFVSADEILKQDYSNKSFCMSSVILFIMPFKLDLMFVCELKFVSVTEVHYMKDNELYFPLIVWFFFSMLLSMFLIYYQLGNPS